MSRATDNINYRSEYDMLVGELSGTNIHFVVGKTESIKNMSRHMYSDSNLSLKYVFKYIMMTCIYCIS